MTFQTEPVTISIEDNHFRIVGEWKELISFAVELDKMLRSKLKNNIWDFVTFDIHNNRFDIVVVDKMDPMDIPYTIFDFIRDYFKKK